MDYYGYGNGKEGKKNKALSAVALIAKILTVFLVVVFILVVFCIVTLKVFPDGIMAYYIIDIVETIQTKLAGI